MEAADGSECLGKCLKFPTPDRIELLIKTALNFKDKLTLLKNEDVKQKKVIEVQAKPIAMNSGWIINSIASAKVPKEKPKGTGQKLSEEKLKIMNEIQSCIEIIESEKKHYNGDNIDKCIKLLKEIREEIE